MLIGLHGQNRLTEEPDQPISFIIEDGLPYGITQESVEAAAEGRAISREPFTMMVVERELEWEESNFGELPEGVDVLLSVGHDPEDNDLVLPDGNRVGLAHLGSQEDSSHRWSVATEIRDVFNNNRSMGHGPSAVVGAAQTAAQLEFNGAAARTPLFWGALAALPMAGAVLFTVLWVKFLGDERQRRRRFAEARLQLARVVLELDTVEVPFRIPESQLAESATAEHVEAAEKLRGDWEK